MKNETLTIRIPSELKAALQAHADAERRSLSAMVQIILEDWAKSTTAPKEGAK